MIRCPNCEHHNPDGAVQCEACYTPLPQQAQCRNCGAMLLTNATFCGQCGIQSPFENPSEEESPPPPPVAPMPPSPPDIVEVSSPPPPPPPVTSPKEATQLQKQTPRLFHQQTQTTLELPQGLAVIHLGKPNDQIPPDIDVSGFPHADIVSRRHADIRVEGDIFYIEDVGSSNGTYINHQVLSPGDRHRLQDGDRISLGKGDLVTFIFQLS